VNSGNDRQKQNLIQEEIQRRLNAGNVFYHSVQNLLSSHVLSKNVNTRICKTIILPVVLYWCETWPLTLREEHRLRRVFEDRVPRKIFGLARYEVMGRWRQLHNKELCDFNGLRSIIRIIKWRVIWVSGREDRI
jgi:hypothetical protein